MQLSELQTFQAIVETGSLVGAADQLNVTQSTVTARLKSLEGTLGQTLIIRNKSGATLTASGERMRRYADTISGLWQQACQEISLPNAMSAVCNFSCHPELWKGLGERFFSHVQTALPDVAISVWHGNDTDLGTWLNSGLSDVVLTYSPKVVRNQILRPLKSQRLVAVSTSSKTSAMPDEGYVFVEGGEEFGRGHAALFSGSPSPRVSFGNAILGLEHITQHGGSAYLPERLIEKHIRDGALYAIPDMPVFERSAFLAANRSAVDAWPWFEDVWQQIS